MFAKLSDVVTPSGTGVNSLWRADSISAARSLPARPTSAFAASSVSQPFTWTRGSPVSGSSNRSPDHDVCTTWNGYPADGVVWMMIAPAAPWRAALSYLYVHRP